MASGKNTLQGLHDEPCVTVNSQPMDHWMERLLYGSRYAAGEAPSESEVAGQA